MSDFILAALDGYKSFFDDLSEGTLPSHRFHPDAKSCLLVQDLGTLYRELLDQVKYVFVPGQTTYVSSSLRLLLNLTPSQDPRG